MPELAGSVVLLDGYFDIRFSPKLRLRSGKDKTPVGYELLIGDAYLIFPERRSSPCSCRTAMSAFRRKAISPAASAVRGRHLQRQPGRRHKRHHRRRYQQRQGSRRACGRHAVQVGQGRAPLSNFGIHLGGSTGDQVGPLPWYRTSAGQTYFSFPATTTADGRKKPSVAGGFPLRQELWRLRRIRAHQHGHRQRRRGANRHQPRVGRDRIVRADGRGDIGARCPAAGALRSVRRHLGGGPGRGAFMRRSRLIVTCSRQAARPPIRAGQRGR